MEALLFLGTHFKERGAFEEAEAYCTRLLDFGGPKKEVRAFPTGLKKRSPAESRSP